MPVLALIHTLIQLFLSHRNLYFSPKSMVIISTIFIPAWLVVASIWTDCEIIRPNSRATSLPLWCPQSVLSTPTIRGHVFHSSLTNMKNSLAWLSTTIYVAYFVFASVAWRKEKKANKDKDMGLGMENYIEIRS
jgi:hypothetical protein